MKRGDGDKGATLSDAKLSNSMDRVMRTDGIVAAAAEFSYGDFE
jgi:hypothetical protein